jgi:hypothetical protein
MKTKEETKFIKVEPGSAPFKGYRYLFKHFISNLKTAAGNPCRQSIPA